MTDDVTERFDFVVVGGGTAGCVVASRLSEDPSISVLLIEAGADERRRDIETPDAWPTLLGTDVDWSFETSLQPGTGRSHAAPRGKVLGGSGSINCMVHLRGHASDFDDWAETGGAIGWDYRKVLPYFKRSEDVPDGDPRYRGRGGPLRPRRFGTEDLVGIRFAVGAARAGHPMVADFNAESMLGVGFPDALIFEDRRESTASAYLRPAMRRPNLTVHERGLVQRLTFERGRCTGVVYVRDGVANVAVATEEVVMCAGAIGTPHLLLLSGIGPADALAALGIDPVMDAPEVGLNLQDHLLLAGIRYQAEDPLPPEHMTSATLLARSEPGAHGPDLHIAVVNADYHHDWQEPLPNSFTFAIGHMRARSRGTVRLASADPAVPPIVDPAYLCEKYDLDQLIRGVEIVEEIVATGAFDDWGGASQTTALLDLERCELERVVRLAADTYSHLAGTCRMGSDPDAVVDSELRVVGVAGLRVADASVMPTLVSCNSNAATIMIGEKAVDLLRAPNATTA
ncbi:GMC family oxidoreductase N-terminal domain-containing protein [Nocardioides sp. AN3]